MADARDLLNAWQDALLGIRGVAAPATDALEQVLRDPAEFVESAGGLAER